MLNYKFDLEYQEDKFPKIMILGDTHGNWKLLNNLIKDQSPDIILHCGDFGYFPRFADYNVNKIENNNTKIFWCPGNHEDWDSLDFLEDNEIKKNIFYMPKGSVLILPDGRSVLFMGGADSIDKNQKIIKFTWFPQEIINQRDIYNLPDEKIQIIISHTCPTEFINEIKNKLSYPINDPSNEALSYVLKKYKPSSWYFAHFHFYKTGTYIENGSKKTNWVCLDKIENNCNFFCWL
jgi:hypothetical protein